MSLQKRKDPQNGAVNQRAHGDMAAKYNCIIDQSLVSELFSI